MQSTLNSKQSDPHEVVEIAPDVVLVAPNGKEPSEPARAAKSRAPESAASAVPPVDTKFRATAVNPGQSTAQAKPERPSFRKRAMRVVRSFLIAMVLALGSGLVAFAWQNYGDTAEHFGDTVQQFGETARATIARWTAQLLPASSPQQASAPAAQPSPVTTQTVAANTASDQAAPPVQTLESATPQAAAPTTVTLPPDSAQLLQSMAHDLATVGQDIAQLKASIEQLKASQEQMARELAKAREQNLRPKVAIAAPPPRSAAMLPLRRPTPAYLPPQGTGAPLARSVPPPLPPQTAVVTPPPPPPMPLQPDAQPDDGAVVRPPMPVR